MLQRCFNELTNGAKCCAADVIKKKMKKKIVVCSSFRLSKPGQVPWNGWMINPASLGGGSSSHSD
jgi:hypothetical protein